ncbi:hypothetical protein HDF16_005429 [Granulicella aggregans]|uniref:BLUF domain-containing protein n=1 Tax=Granulicella aggregans TaxID=474949 RepID=A0A7W8E601_9BACT|nr:BLUF domain-containing protein [Granulicella aggregans]MBB5060693.1 hypothetical protein [Granulicella aggregans]
MTEDIYRILYCSRNSLSGSIEQQKTEIAKILAKSRANNPARGITGALMFNSGFFAQVLEGPLEQVERTFETIQRDMRHDDISVLQCGNVPQRDFPEWSMAYAKADSGETESLADLNLAELLENQSTAAAEISNLLRSLVVQDDEYTCV